MLNDVLHQASDTWPEFREPVQACTLAHLAVDLEDGAEHSVQGRVLRAKDRLIPELWQIEWQHRAVWNIALWRLDVLEICLAHGLFESREQSGERLLVIPD